MVARSASISIGPLKITKEESGVPIKEMETVGGERSTGVAIVFFVSGLKTKLDVRFIRWKNGEREVRCFASKSSNLSVTQLGEGRRRLEIRRVGSGPYRKKGSHYAVLKQARIKELENGWSGLFQAKMRELNKGAGVKVEEALLELGALQVGSRERLLDETGKTRGQLCVVFEEDEGVLPVAVFTLTRILPLMNGVVAS